MLNTKKITMMKTRLYITNTFHTLIKGTIIINEEQHIDGYFLLDSACSNNILNKHIGIKVKDNNKDSKPFATLNCQETVASSTNLQISINGNETEEEMSIIECNHELFLNPSLPVLGILGITYLVNHKICIDYENMMMYELPIDRDWSLFKTKCPFAFGIRKYGIAIVGIENGIEDNVMMTLLDTGSNLNIVCEQALNAYPFEHPIIDKIQDISDVNTSSAMKGCILDFSLVMIEDEKMYCKPMKEEFYIDEYKEYLLREEGAKQIEAIIGNKFMISNKCILDFSTGYMYSSIWG